MKMITKYLKSSRILRFLLVFTVFAIITIIFSMPFSPSHSFDVDGMCEKQETTEKSCVFICNFMTEEENVTGRIIVVHSGWTAIYDKEFEMKPYQNTTLRIEIPLRKYVYRIRGAFYNQDHYGILTDKDGEWKLNC